MAVDPVAMAAGPVVMAGALTHGWIPVPPQLEFAFLSLFAIGAMVREVEFFYEIFFGDLNLNSHLFRNMQTLTNQQRALLSRPSSPSRADVPPPAERPFQILTVTLELARDALHSGHRWSSYLEAHSIDLVVRMLCLITLSHAWSYSKADLDLVQISLFNPETLFSFTVLLVWVRKTSLLRCFPATGAIVFMFERMVVDVTKWASLYVIGLVAFASALTVLYHNHRAAIPMSYDAIQSDCVRLDSQFGSIVDSILFLLMVNLGSDPRFDCFQNTSADVPGVCPPRAVHPRVAFWV